MGLIFTGPLTKYFRQLFQWNLNTTEVKYVPIKYSWTMHVFTFGGNFFICRSHKLCIYAVSFAAIVKLIISSISRCVRRLQRNCCVLLFCSKFTASKFVQTSSARFHAPRVLDQMDVPHVDVLQCAGYYTILCYGWLKMATLKAVLKYAYCRNSLESLDCDCDDLGRDLINPWTAVITNET